MKTTEILVEEHHLILKVLDCLEKCVEETVSTEKLQESPAKNMLDFIHNFADHCHHEKEENILFGMMESAGVPREGGPIGCMLKEHDLGRKLVKTMTSALEGASQGNKETLKTFCDAADDFILLLRGHITKENNVLFMIAEQVIPETQKKKIQHDFAEFNQKHLDCYRRYFTMVKKLCERYQLPFCLPSQFKAIVVE